VVNALHYRTLSQMGEMARALGKRDEAMLWSRQSARVKRAFNAVLFDEAGGVYLDGAGVSHSSLHANLFPLAFGLVPRERKPKVTGFIKSKGMACSVYPAQFLLEALFENGEAEYAISLMTSDDIRSWRNMIRSGSTITTEAWDTKFKPNQDWNHAWGAAPANIIPRYVLGVRPAAAGFAQAVIAPQVGRLNRVKGVVPTVRGSVRVEVDGAILKVGIPEGMTARVTWGQSREVKSGEHVFQRSE
jgi:alpha-L-rhamnosidase